MATFIQPHRERPVSAAILVAHILILRRPLRAVFHVRDVSRPAGTEARSAACRKESVDRLMLAEVGEAPATNAVTHPNFFLVGAARGGTTSLWQYLRDHPEIHMPAGLAGKEPSFFCDL